jgi:beta-lactamase class C
MPLNISKHAAAIFCCLTMLLPRESHAATGGPVNVGEIVTAAVKPIMRQYGVPGMAVGVVFNGRDYVFDYGVASKATRRPVTANTLFEIGSISKTFNATLAMVAQANGDLSLSDMASSYMPSLRGSAFDKVSLADLGTYTAGGLPLQVPDQIHTNAQLLAYFKAWKPRYPPGTTREYSNPSIGFLGFITAARLHVDYASFLQTRMFPALGLDHSYLNIPASQMKNYAEGYDDDGTPIRMTQGVLWAEVVGVRTTAGDLLRWLAINMTLVKIDPQWQRAALATHTGYDQLQPGEMIQDLVWEQYDLPVTLAALQAGNGYDVLMKPQPVTAFEPPLVPRPDVLLDKTGSTNGFGAYVAYIPAKRIGVVLLANRNYPIPARVAAAYEILNQLAGDLSEKPSPRARD